MTWTLLDVDDTKEYLGVCGHAGCLAIKNERRFYSPYLEDFSAKNKVMDKPGGERDFVLHLHEFVLLKQGEIE